MPPIARAGGGPVAGWPSTVAVAALSITWWAIKTLALIGSVSAVALYTVDWQGLVIQPVLQEASRWASMYIDGIDAESIKGYVDLLVDELEKQVGAAENLPSTVKKIRWALTMGESALALAVGLGSEWWVSRRKNFSFTRGIMYSTGMFAALKALEFDLYATALVSGIESVTNLDFDWKDIRAKVHKMIDDRFSDHGL